MLTSERLAYSPAEAAEILGVTRAHIYNLVERGLLSRHKIGRCSRIRADEIYALIGGPPDETT